MSKLLWLGLTVLLAGFVLLAAGSAGQGNVSTGGVVFIGPFPFAFGSGPEGWQLALASVVIGGVMLALLLLWGWRLVRTRQG
jgi:uncharacterized membrane protein